MQREQKVPKELKEPKEPRGLTVLYTILIVLYTVIAIQEGGECILSESVSNESDFQVNLTEGVSYKLGIVSSNGPEKINVTVSKGSSFAFEDTFKLTKSKKNYLPYNPKFTVEENGTYHVHAEPLDPGTVNLTIKKSIIPKFS